MFFIICLIFNLSTSFSFKISECNSYVVDEKYAKAYFGWPFRFRCSSFRNLVYDDSRFLQNFFSDEIDNTTSVAFVDIKNKMIQCILLNQNQSTVFNQSTNFMGLRNADLGFVTTFNENSSLDYSMILVNPTGKQCVLFVYHINVTHSKEENNCSYYLANERRQFRKNIGSYMRVACADARRVNPKLDNFQEVTYRWLHDCRPIQANTSILQINSISFEDAGTYMCAAEYNDKIVYIRFIDICIKHPVSITELEPKCDLTNIRAETGEIVTQTCTINYGYGHLEDARVEIYLKKLTDQSSIPWIHAAFCEKKNNIITDNYEKIICEWKVENYQCFSQEPPKEKQQAPDALVDVKIIFRNVTDQDFGTYILEVNNIVEGYGRTNTTFALGPNYISKLTSQSVIAGAISGLLVFIFVLIIIMLHKRLLIKVYYKRYFASSLYDDKPFGVYLAYSYCHHSMDKFSKEVISDIIPKVRDVLEALGYRVYDEKKDGFLSTDRAESIWKAIEGSHRVVIVLNQDFIKDDWSILALQKGFNETIHCRSKLIFILLPGIKEHLKQISKWNDSYATMQRAVNLNYSVELGKTPNLKHLKLCLEDAMPKLKSTKRVITAVQELAMKRPNEEMDTAL